MRRRWVRFGRRLQGQVAHPQAAGEATSSVAASGPGPGGFDGPGRRGTMTHDYKRHGTTTSETSAPALCRVKARSAAVSSTRSASNSVDPAGWTDRQDMLPQLDPPVDLAVDNEVLAPLDIALDDDPLPYRGDVLGSVRQTGTLSARRRQTPDRCIVSKAVSRPLKATLDSSRGSGRTVHAPPASAST